MNSPYLAYLLPQIEEVCEKYDIDGLFLDVAGVFPCYCQNCVRAMRDAGRDPYNEQNSLELAEAVYANYAKRVREAVDRHKPGLRVFHNVGHIRRGRRDLALMNSHLELESLPTGGWGYDHFPLSAAYARTLGLEFSGMTGKFHQSWGEFGGFKHPNALRYEAALSAANGARCSVGDQLHPSGKMDEASYTLIGAAYSELETKEEWLAGAENIADIGVFTVESAENYFDGIKATDTQFIRTGVTDAGCTRVLLEGHYLFNAIDADEDFSKYKLIVLPDCIRLDEFLTEKCRRFIAAGGKILASGTSGLKHDGDEFTLDYGVEYQGTHPYQPGYLKP